ncbi:MAG: peptide chain release factor N(5)-glutamine methyltransferase [Oscillospiraceae bacterium]|nr:peptide chain release factor N(5)-glutamine methyltransferase [Oscillospiraceae bacterium]
MVIGTFGEAYRHVRLLLSASEEQRASFAARELLSLASGHDAAVLMSMSYDPIPKGVLERYLRDAERVARGEPLAYVLGSWSFYGLDLTVTPDVLIPRDDTMVVTELVLSYASSAGSHPKILDLCTGSGCIGLAVAFDLPQAEVVLCDVSENALRIAKKNVADLSLLDRVICLQADVLQPPAAELGMFDMIVSNPPYITGEEMKELDRSVLDHEPHLALYGGEDGLVFYRAIIDNYSKVLKDGGYLAFEFGLGQDDAVCRLLAENGYDVMETKKDTGDIVRAVIARKKERTNAYGNG